MCYSCLYVCADYPCRVVYLAAYANIWVYPFLAKMPPVMMSLFFAGCYVISLILYFGGMLLSYVRYGSEFTCVSHHGGAVLLVAKVTVSVVSTTATHLRKFYRSCYSGQNNDGG